MTSTFHFLNRHTYYICAMEAIKLRSTYCTTKHHLCSHVEHYYTICRILSRLPSLPANFGSLRLGRQLAGGLEPLSIEYSIVQSSSNLLQHSATTPTVRAYSHSYVQVPAWQLEVVPIVKHHALTTHDGEWIIGSTRHWEKKFSLQTFLCRSKFSTLTSHRFRMPPKRTPWRRNDIYQHMETYFK
jgi:hypothetical protein